MATYNTLTKGSTGADVKKLQQSLIDKGYDLGKTGADGKYGAKTQAAVTQYQKDNKLTVDGMAGKQTQGALYTVPKTTTTTPTTGAGTKTGAGTNTGATSGVGAGAGAGAKAAANAAANAVAGAADHAVENAKTNETDPLAPPAATAYDPATDAAYQSALATLLQVQQTAPTYKDSYSSQLQDVYNSIVNREKFSFDVNSDAMYQQYKDQYIAQGKLAMADTMGQAAAMNGGYGTSYGQSVGQQAYQGYMQQLNDRVPELYGMALDRYNQEGQDMLNQYAMLGDMADDEYAKYQDSLNKYYRDVDMAIAEADKAYDRGYGAYRDSVGDGQWQQSFDHGVEQDKIGNEQWEKSFEHGVEQDKIHNDQTQQQINENIKQNEIGNKQWEDSFGYQKDRDAVEDSRYEEESDRMDRQENYNRVMSLIGAGVPPTEKDLFLAGISEEQYNAMSKYANTAGGTTTRDNVKAMSSMEIVEAMQGFGDAGDNTGLEAFLDDCVATGRMTEEEADQNYLRYGTGLVAPGVAPGVVSGGAVDHFGSVIAGGVAKGPYHSIFTRK